VATLGRKKGKQISLWRMAASEKKIYRGRRESKRKEDLGGVGHSSLESSGHRNWRAGQRKQTLKKARVVQQSSIETGLLSEFQRDTNRGVHGPKNQSSILAASGWYFCTSTARPKERAARSGRRIHRGGDAEMGNHKVPERSPNWKVWWVVAEDWRRELQRKLGEARGPSDVKLLDMPERFWVGR